MAPAISVRIMISRSRGRHRPAASPDRRICAVDGHLDISPELADEMPWRARASACGRTVRWSRQPARRRDRHISGRGRAPEPGVGKQLLDMRRAPEGRDRKREAPGELRGQDIGEPAAFFLVRVRRRDFGVQRVLVQPLDQRAEQRFPGFEIMIQRLPRQPGSFRRLLDRRPPKPCRRNTSIAASRMRSRASFDELTKGKKCQITTNCPAWPVLTQAGLV